MNLEFNKLTTHTLIELKDNVIKFTYFNPDGQTLQLLTLQLCNLNSIFV